MCRRTRTCWRGRRPSASAPPPPRPAAGGDNSLQIPYVAHPFALYVVQYLTYEQNIRARGRGQTVSPGRRQHVKASKLDKPNPSSCLPTRRMGKKTKLKKRTAAGLSDGVLGFAPRAAQNCRRPAHSWWHHHCWGFFGRTCWGRLHCLRSASCCGWRRRRISVGWGRRPALSRCALFPPRTGVHISRWRRTAASSCSALHPNPAHLHLCPSALLLLPAGIPPG